MNTYKIATIVLLLLWISTILYFTRSSKEHEHSLTPEEFEEIQQFNSIMEVDQELLDEWEFMNRHIDSVHTGKRISIDSASIKLNSFRKWNSTLGGIIKRIKPYGFAFGTSRLRTMLHAIDSTNSVLRQNNNLDSLIHGVRINLTHSFKNKKPHLDVLLVPIMANGKNYYDLSVHPIDEDRDDLLLNTSVPCPDICD